MGLILEFLARKQSLESLRVLTGDSTKNEADFVGRLLLFNPFACDHIKPASRFYDA